MTASGKFLIITHFLSCGKKSDTLICTKNSDISTYVLTQKTNIYIFCSDSDIKGPKISGKSIFCKSEVHLFHDKSKETTLTKNIVPWWRFQFLFIFSRNEDFSILFNSFHFFFYYFQYFFVIWFHFGNPLTFLVEL